MFFQYFFENVDLVKIIVFPKENCYFSGFEPPKNHEKSMPKRTRKIHRKKTSQKSILAPIWASKTLPKSIENRKNSKKTPSKKRRQKTSSGNHRPGPETTRKSRLLGPRRTIQPLFQ